MYEARNAVDFFDMVGQTAWHQDLQRILIHWVGIRDTDEVLDAGCGAGHFVLKLAQRAQSVTGLDVSEAMVRRAQLTAEDHRAHNTAFVVGSVTAIPLPDAAFDLITCLNVLFMFQRLDIPVSECLRVLKPHGQLIVLDPSPTMNPWTAQAYCESHGLRDFERDSLLSWATAAARYGPLDTERMSVAVRRAGGTIAQTVPLLDGLAVVYRVVHVDAGASAG